MVPSLFRAAVLLGLFLSLPTAHVLAQESPGLGSDGSVGAIVSVRPTASQVADHFMPLLGLGFALRLTPNVEIGGDGFFSLRSVRVSPDNSPDRSELALGYGGVFLRYGPGSESGNRGWNAGILAGTGTARIESALVDAELDADNFFVIEPSLEYRLPLTPRIGVAAGLSYRLTGGADPLPGVEASAIQGPSLSVAIQFIRDP